MNRHVLTGVRAKICPRTPWTKVPSERARACLGVHGVLAMERPDRPEKAEPETYQRETHLK